jgi:hypothetical protein
MCSTDSLIVLHWQQMEFDICEIHVWWRCQRGNYQTKINYIRLRSEFCGGWKPEA